MKPFGGFGGVVRDCAKFLNTFNVMLEGMQLGEIHISLDLAADENILVFVEHVKGSFEIPKGLSIMLGKLGSVCKIE